MFWLIPTCCSTEWHVSWKATRKWNNFWLMNWHLPEPLALFVHGKMRETANIALGSALKSMTNLEEVIAQVAHYMLDGSRAGVKYVFVFVFKYANICICIWKLTRWNICICIWLAYLGVFDKHFSNTLFNFTLYSIIMIMINIIFCLFHNP